MTPDYISPQETESEKNKLIKLLIPKLKAHGLVDVTAFVKEHSEIHENHRHPGFVRSLSYKVEELGIGEVIPQNNWTEFYIKRNIFSKRHPYRFAIILGLIGVVFSIIAGITNAIVSDKLKTKESQKTLADSIANIRTELQKIQDSIQSYKHR